jgi:hypothetical protein
VLRMVAKIMVKNVQPMRTCIYAAGNLRASRVLCILQNSLGWVNGISCEYDCDLHPSGILMWCAVFRSK